MNGEVKVILNFKHQSGIENPNNKPVVLQIIKYNIIVYKLG